VKRETAAFSSGFQKFTGNQGRWLGWSQPADTEEMAANRGCCGFTAENLVDNQCFASAM
jgi:hypothetical protein